ncbi:hypothetical protein GC163_15645 [bacterium]|nr:hypothetical protein [bacterium]
MFRSSLIVVAMAAAAMLTTTDSADAAAVRVYRGPARSRVVVRGPYNTYRYSAPRAYYGPRVYRGYGYGYASPYGAYYGRGYNPYVNGGIYYNGPRTNVWFRY